MNCHVHGLMLAFCMIEANAKNVSPYMFSIAFKLPEIRLPT